MAIIEKDFGTTQDGIKVYLYEINNTNGAAMQVTNFGAVLVSLLVPDKENHLVDVVLGYDKVTGYENNTTYFGSTIGRNGNRIAGGHFYINGKEYQLKQNEKGNNLHSGPLGYETQIWEVKAIDDSKNSITFYRKSPDMEQGFPGNFDISVTYELTNQNALIIHYEGVSDADTVANLTNHSYFNLGGHDSGDILNHELKIEAEYFTPVSDSQAIPTGLLDKVEETPMDFNQMKKICTDADADYEQLIFTGGYDHNYVVNDTPGNMKTFAKAYCSETGISMTVASDLPGVQFYAGNGIDNVPGKGNAVYRKHAAFCLETQYYPNAVNVPEFPSPVLKAEEPYSTTTIYQFGTE